MPFLRIDTRIGDIDALSAMPSPFAFRYVPKGGRPSGTATRFVCDDLTIGFLTRSPSIVEGELCEHEAFIASYISPDGAERINGVHVPAQSILGGRRGATYYAVEDNDVSHFTVTFPRLPQQRDWTSLPAAFSVVPGDRRAQQRLNDRLATIFSALVAIPALPDRSLAGISRSFVIDEAHDAIDEYLSSGDGQRWSTIATGRHFRLCAELNQIVRTLEPRIPCVSELASRLDTTVRTLHNASVAVYGRSLSSYLLEQRLWRVRRALLTAGDFTQIKAVALDHGFFHFGRFAMQYRRAFGEPPSRTLYNATHRLP